MITLDRPEIKYIWSNCSDSLRHAGDHLAEWIMLEDKPCNLQDKTHHGKWAVISVGHASDCYLKIIAKELDPNCPLFVPKPGKLFRTPCVPETIEYLKKKHRKELQDSWKTFFIVLEYVNYKRNDIIHGIMPEDLPISVSVAAWGLFGLLRSIRKKYAINSDAIIDRSPPIETDLIDLIKLPRLQPYMKYVETSLAESCDIAHLDCCPLCGAISVLNGRCEVCFQSVSTIECNHCGEHCIVPDDPNLAHHLELNICPSCGDKF
jgi:hypothetical protein